MTLGKKTCLSSNQYPQPKGSIRSAFLGTFAQPTIVLSLLSAFCILLFLFMVYSSFTIPSFQELSGLTSAPRLAVLSPLSVLVFPVSSNPPRDQSGDFPPWLGHREKSLNRSDNCATFRCGVCRLCSFGAPLAHHFSCFRQSWLVFARDSTYGITHGFNLVQFIYERGPCWGWRSL